MRRTLATTRLWRMVRPDANDGSSAAHHDDRTGQPTDEQPVSVDAPLAPPLRVSSGVPDGATRTFASIVPTALWDAIQPGTLSTFYRGIPCLKSPFDLALYLQLIGRQLPRTIIEIGSASGGSALWFADMLTCHGIAAPRVVSVDIEPPADVHDERITFLRGDARALDGVLSEADLDRLERPWMVVEDSSHMFEDSIAVLDFFDAYLRTGDYIIVEDGNLTEFGDPMYLRYDAGPNRAVKSFLEQHPATYEIDVSLCDHYGTNVTYNPNGWIRRL